MIYKQDEHKWNLPDTVNFEPGAVIPGQRCFYRVLGYRNPEAGEYFLSGALVEAYYTKHGIPSKYLVVEPTHKAVPTTVYVRGEPVETWPSGRMR